MYCTHCEDPNCVNCSQTLRDENCEKKQDPILFKVKELLLLSSNKKGFCIERCRKIKEEISDRINSLINVLKERERELYAQVDQKCYIQMTRIDYDVTSHYDDNLMKTSDESEKDFCPNGMVFDCEFDYIFGELKKFGQLSYEDSLMLFKNKFVKHSQEPNQLLKKLESTSAENIALSTTPLNCSVKTANKVEKLKNLLKSLKEDEERLAKHSVSLRNKEFKMENSLDEYLKSLSLSPRDEEQHFEENTDSVSNTEVEKDDSVDEEDIEIISISEAADIPSKFLSMPQKNRFRFSKKRSCFPSLFSKKPLLMPKESVSEYPICSQNKSEECTAAFTHEERNEKEQIQPRQTSKESSIESFNLLLNEQVGQESSGKDLTMSKNFTSSDSNPIKRNLSALMSLAEREENPSFSKQSSQDSSKNYDNSDVECQDQNPSLTLLSSFKKYLEKNAESEWLAPEKKTEQLLHPGNSGIFNRDIPFLTKNVDQWLSKRNNQKVFSDWLYTAQD